MLDLTKEIQLNPHYQSLYKKLRLVLYILAISITFYLAYLILFPHKYYAFSFLNPHSNKNSLSIPLLNKSHPDYNGVVPANSSLSFDANLADGYSKIKITLTTLHQSSNLTHLAVSLRKSYQAFLYKKGSPIGFRDGSLLKNNQHFYLISDGHLREFSQLNILKKLGYNLKSFQTVTPQDLKYNPLGSPITSFQQYPNSTIFKINTDYYLLVNQRLEKFVSTQAFKTRYQAQQSIEKNISFLKKYPLAKNSIGFADGTLVSRGISVYILSQGVFYPINNAQTFESKGWQWKNIIPINENELAIYKKGKLFNIKGVHPTGTIFKVLENSHYYLIKNHQKHLLPTPAIANSWLFKGPILISGKSLTTMLSCYLKKDLLSSSTYSCETTTQQLANLIGHDYEFKVSPPKNIQLSFINLDFKKDFTKLNLKNSLKNLFYKIIGNYVQIHVK